jgi:hypothetical protein
MANSHELQNENTLDRPALTDEAIDRADGPRIEEAIEAANALYHAGYQGAAGLVMEGLFNDPIGRAIKAAQWGKEEPKITLFPR